MNIKNYTSSVPVSRTIARIEELVAEAGATGIQKDYKNGRVEALYFRVITPRDGQTIAIRLPSDSEAVYDNLRKQIKRPRPGTLENLRDQADRTSWKLMQDWVEVQLSLIHMQKADILQVFLAYVCVDGQHTFYDRLKRGNFKMLMDSPK